MKNVLSIINTKPSTLEFEVGIDGFEPSKVDVCLCIKTKDYYLKFPCKKNKSNWECKIPTLGHVEKGAYPYVIEVVADGYHFEAASGTANVAGSFDVYAKKPDKLAPGEIESKKETTPIKKETKKEEAKVAKKVEHKKVESKKETTPIKKETKKETKKESLNLKDGKFTSMVNDILKKKDPTETKKKEEPLVEDTKVDVIKQIVSETKNSKTKIPTLPMKKVEEPIIKKEEPKKKVLEEKVEPKSEKDDNVKNILKNLNVQEELKEGNVSPLFKKGKRVVH